MTLDCAARAWSERSRRIRPTSVQLGDTARSLQKPSSEKRANVGKKLTICKETVNRPACPLRIQRHRRRYMTNEM